MVHMFYSIAAEIRQILADNAETGADELDLRGGQAARVYCMYAGLGVAGFDPQYRPTFNGPPDGHTAQWLLAWRAIMWGLRARYPQLSEPFDGTRAVKLPESDGCVVHVGGYSPEDWRPRAREWAAACDLLHGLENGKAAGDGGRTRDSDQCGYVSLIPDRRLVLVEWLESQPGRFARVVNVPYALLDADLFTVCDYDGMIEFATLQPGTHPNSAMWHGCANGQYKAWGDVLPDLDPDNHTFLVRATGKGRGELSTWRLNAATGNQSADHIEGRKTATPTSGDDAEPPAPPDVEACRWIIVADAARSTGMNSGEISRAATAGRLKSNDKTGRARRIDSVDLVRFGLERAKKPEKTESDEAVKAKFRKNRHTD